MALKKFNCAFLAASLIVNAGASAADYAPIALEQNLNDPYYGDRSGVRAQIYVRVPFGGEERRVMDKTRVGLSLTSDVAAELQYRAGSRAQLNYLDISARPTGFGAVEINGYSPQELAVLYADSEGKGFPWLWVAGGVVATMGLAFGIYYLTYPDP